MADTIKQSGDELYSPSESGVWKGWYDALSGGIQNAARFLPRGEEGAPYGGLTPGEKATANYPVGTSRTLSGPGKMTGPDLGEGLNPPPVSALDGSPIPAPAAGTVVPSTSAPAPPVPTNQDQQNLEMIKQLGASGLLPADFFLTHPEFNDRSLGVAKVGDVTESPSDMRRKLEGAGVGVGGVKDADLADVYRSYSQSHQGFDISQKLYAFLEPEKSTKIENTMSGITNMIAGKIRDITNNPSGNPLYDSQAIAHLTGQIPGMSNAQNTALKTPAEIENINAQTGAHRALMSEAPAKIKELEAQANYYNRDPEKHDNVVMQGQYHIVSTAMQELAKSQGIMDKEGIKYWTETLNGAYKAIDALTSKMETRKKQSVDWPTYLREAQKRNPGVSPDIIKKKYSEETGNQAPPG